MILDGKTKDYGLFDKNCNKIKYLISKKSGITHVILEGSFFILPNRNFGRVRIVFYVSQLSPVIQTLQNLIRVFLLIIARRKIFLFI